jgi:membrane-bound ClpP family serine protease
MEGKVTTIETLVDKTEDYVKTSIDLFKLKAVDKSAEVVSTLSVKIACLLITGIVALLVNVGLALLIGEAIGKIYIGFFVVAAFYLLVLGLIMLFKNEWIKTPVSNAVINSFFKTDFI